MHIEISKLFYTNILQGQCFLYDSNQYQIISIKVLSLLYDVVISGMRELFKTTLLAYFMLSV